MERAICKAKVIKIAQVLYIPSRNGRNLFRNVLNPACMARNPFFPFSFSNFPVRPLRICHRNAKCEMSHCVIVHDYRWHPRSPKPSLDSPRARTIEGLQFFFFYLQVLNLLLVLFFFHFLPNSLLSLPASSHHQSLFTFQLAFPRALSLAS